MPAPKPNTHEWKRMIFMALAGGVTLRKKLVKFGGQRYATTRWEARFQDGSICCHGDTKYEAAEFAVSTLMGNFGELPDAAKAPKTAP